MYISRHAFSLTLLANPQSEFFIGEGILGLNKVAIQCFKPALLFSRDMPYQIYLSLILCLRRPWNFLLHKCYWLIKARVSPGSITPATKWRGKQNFKWGSPLHVTPGDCGMRQQMGEMTILPGCSENRELHTSYVWRSSPMLLQR